MTVNGREQSANITTIAPTIARKIPGANAGVENILKLYQVFHPTMNSAANMQFVAVIMTKTWSM
tara:strand:- start:770 stop:961 length:192 start_codon:yes stop_codon:yes gene_type:complete